LPPAAGEDDDRLRPLARFRAGWSGATRSATHFSWSGRPEL